MTQFKCSLLSPITIVLTTLALCACATKVALDQEASPDIVFHQYLKAMATGKLEEAYPVYLTKNSIKRSDKQLEHLTDAQKQKMKVSARRAAKCTNHKLLSQKNIDDKTRKLVYAITNHCAEIDTLYRQVIFKQENGWKIDAQTVAVENIYIKEPKHSARVVAAYNTPQKNKKRPKKLSSPDAVFKAYKQAVVTGELDAYARFYTPALLAKTNKQLQGYNKRQILNLQRWNQKIMSCRDDKIVSKTINRNTAKIIYALTNTCKKKPTVNYQRVIFKRKSINSAEREHGWKIDRLTLSKHNDFNADGNLKLQRQNQ